MQFIDEDAVHVVVRSETPALYDPATRQMVAAKRRRVYAKFTRGTAPSYAIELAKQMFGFNKKPAEIAVERWCAFYDSKQAQYEFGWTDEEREAIEERLIRQGYVQAEKPKLPAPYRNYDAHRKTVGKRTIEHVIADITATFEAAGFDIDAAAAYEAENGNSPEVLAALAALKPAAEPEAEEQVIAA